MWVEDMEEHEGRGSRGSKEGAYRDIEGVGRRAGREEVFLRGEIWARGLDACSVLVLVSYIRDVWGLQCGGGMPQADGVGEEVHGEGECV